MVRVTAQLTTKGKRKGETMKEIPRGYKVSQHSGAKKRVNQEPSPSGAHCRHGGTSPTPTRLPLRTGLCPSVY